MGDILINIGINMECLICRNKVKNYIALGLHLKKHNISSKEYYDNYLRSASEGYCLTCGKETTFQGIRLGYLRFCCPTCAQLNTDTRNKYKKTCKERLGVENAFQSETVKEKIKNTVKEKTGYEYTLQNPKTRQKAKQTKQQRYGNENYNNVKKAKATNLEKYGVESFTQTDVFRQDICSKIQHNPQQTVETHFANVAKVKASGLIPIQELFYLYGQSWYKNKLVPIIYKHHSGFVTKENANYVKQYYMNNNGHSSQQENILYKLLQKYYSGTIIRGDRSILQSYELDFYLPELKLAFEYNGIYWHSTKMKQPDYHFQKSIECFNKGIRLIHIFEFEDWSLVEKFIKSIFTNTEVPNNDFNKYSPLQYEYTDVSFSGEEIIYTDKYGFIIYGSGTFNLLR